MPKEIIHWGHQYTVKHHPETKTTGGWDEEFRYTGTVEGEPKPEVHRTPTLEVHWSKAGEFAPVPYDEDPEGHVQIALNISAREVLLAAKAIETGSTAYGFFTDSMSRYQINQLIKVLKRARDSAKGPDE